MWVSLLIFLRSIHILEIPIPTIFQTKSKILYGEHKLDFLENLWVEIRLIHVKWNFVSRNSGDENHVVMNEKVQALAGSIYEEFEKMLQRWVVHQHFKH